MSRARLNNLLRTVGGPLLALAVLFIAYEMWRRISGQPHYLVPDTPDVIVVAVTDARDTLLPAAWVTLKEAIYGLLLAATIGWTLGVVAQESRILEKAVMPYAVVSQAVPTLAIAPLLIIWFGFGALPKILVAALISFFPILINTYAGMRSLESEYLDLMYSFEAGRWQTLFKVRLPAAVPFMFAGLKNASVLAVVGALVAEWVGAHEGMGPLILRSLGVFRTATVFAAILYLAFMSIALFWVVSLIERIVLRFLYGRQSLTAAV